MHDAIRAHPAPSASRTEALPLISIVIPAFEVAPFLGACLSSVLREVDAARVLGAAECDIIVVDDCSKDSTGAIARDLLAGRPDARVMTHETNRGPAAARNTGVDAGRGGYILFLDSDNTLLEGSLARIARVLVERADADVLILGMDLIDERGEPLGLFYGERVPANPIGRLQSDPFVLLEGNIMDAFGVVRASAARSAGYDEALCQLSDWDFWLRLHYEHQCRFAMLEDSVGGYRLRQGQMSQLHTPQTVSYNREMLRIYSKALAMATRLDLPGPVVRRLMANAQNAGSTYLQLQAASARVPQPKCAQSGETARPASTGPARAPLIRRAESGTGERKSMLVLNASHGGDSSDIVYGLAVARRLAEAHSRPVRLYIPRDRAVQRGDGTERQNAQQFTMSERAFEFLRPYLAIQPYVEEVIFAPEVEIPKDAVRLDPHRFLPGINVNAGNIADFAGKIYGIPVDASQAWLQAGDGLGAGGEGPRWPITVGFSMRLRNAAIDYSFLAHLDGVRFVGLVDEYEEFRSRYALPNLIYHSCATCVELAVAIRSARVFIGNQSLAFAIAEGLKVNRALESCELAPNVVPCGPGAGSFIYQSGLTSLLHRWGIELPQQAWGSAPAKFLLHLPPASAKSAEVRSSDTLGRPTVPCVSGSQACAKGTGASHAVKAALGIRIVCATRKTRETFFSETALGKSLALRRSAEIELRLFPRNGAGLPSIYNTAISESADRDLILLFVHDDVHLCDFHWADRLREGLASFDIVGLAGNRRRIARQPGWGFMDERLTPDARENLSGIVGHGQGFPSETIDEFGPTGQAVALLDGLFLAVKSETLRARSLRFDERFDFHFYDLDFCRQAERAGLTMGTWPISVVHESRGSYAGESWRRGYERYLEKWTD